MYNPQLETFIHVADVIRIETSPMTPAQVLVVEGVPLLCSIYSPPIIR